MIVFGDSIFPRSMLWWLLANTHRFDREQNRHGKEQETADRSERGGPRAS